MTSKLSLASTIIRLEDNDRTVEGLRIPPNLDSVTSVSFVLTQEPGKLKPKDLKAAIEKNRAEREMRAQEQQKLRDIGSGVGILDLRTILAEEKLNAQENDPFKRQLREIAFLADVEDVEKQEAEKEFRISEDYVGYNLLNDDELQLIQKQRNISKVYSSVSRWRSNLERQHSKYYGSNAATTSTQLKAGTLLQYTQDFMSTLQPHYDPNRNDVWAKRLNTLRRLIYLVSRFIIRQRVDKRLKKILKYFHENDAYTRPEVLAFIEKENLEAKNKGGVVELKENEPDDESELTEQNKIKLYEANQTNVTLPEILLAEMNIGVSLNERNKKILTNNALAIKNGEPELTKEMAKRNLFPTFDRDLLANANSSAKELEAGTNIKDYLMKPPRFNDFTFYHIRVQSHVTIQGYKPMALPSIPIHFPKENSDPILPKLRAPEESMIRSSMDSNITMRQLEKLIQASNLPKIINCSIPEPLIFDIVRKEREQEFIETLNANRDPESDPTIPLTKVTPAGNGVSAGLEVMSYITGDHAIPSWLQDNDNVVFDHEEVDSFEFKPQYRKFQPELFECESDLYYSLLPHHNDPHKSDNPQQDSDMSTLNDQSLRRKWIEGHGHNVTSGFLSCNYYLFHGHESCQRTTERISMAAKLFDYYIPDNDRHTSGLSCYAQDHLRGINEWDPDVKGFQQTLDPADHLTDSESDNEEDEYLGDHKPSMALVREMLKPKKKEVPPPEPVGKGGKDAGKGGKDAKGAAKVPEPVVAPKVEEDAMTFHLDEENKKEEQVELLRDRKILEFESTLLKERKQSMESVMKRYLNLMNATLDRSQPKNEEGCLLNTVSIQIPFHLFEEDVYKNYSNLERIPEPPNIFVESDPSKINHLASNTSLSLGSLNSLPPSPEKTFPTTK